MRRSVARARWVAARVSPGRRPDRPPPGSAPTRATTDCRRSSVRGFPPGTARRTATGPWLAQNALHGFEHAGGLERLDNEVFRARLNGLDDQRLLPHGAAHQDLRVRILFDDLADGIDAAHVRHHDVHRDKV